MRRLPLLVLVAAAAAGEGDLEREIEALIATMKQEKAAGAVAPFSSRIDPDALVEEMASQGLPADGIKEKLTGHPELLARLDSQFQVDALRLRKVVATPDGAIAVVDLRMDDYTSRSRLVLFRRDGAWRIRDLDVPDVGMRMSTALGIGIQAMRKDRAASAAFRNLLQAGYALQEGDCSRALELLDASVGELPDRLDAARLACRAGALMGTSRHEEALAACDEAQRKHADMPIVFHVRAACLLELGRAEEALVSVRRYVEAVGETADTWRLTGAALAALGKASEAADAYRAGLREDPLFTGNLHGLLLSHPGEKTEEIALHLRRTGDAPGAFLDIGWDLGEANEWAALRALVAAHRTVEPEHPWIDYFTALLLRSEGKPLDALTRIAGAVRKLEPGEDRGFFAELHAEMAIECGRAIETYEAMPETFGDLATALSERDDVKGLAALVARRAEDGKPDAALRHWMIEVAWLEDREEDVVRLAELHEDELREADDRLLDDRWIRSLVHLRREEEALRQARRAADADDGHYYLLLVRVAFGRSAEAIREFERCVEEGSEPSELYGDDDLAPLAKDEAYAPLRARYPPPEDDE